MQNPEDRQPNDKGPIPIPEHLNSRQTTMYPDARGVQQGEVLGGRIPPRSAGVSKNIFAVALLMIFILNGFVSYIITNTFAPSVPTVDVIAGQVNANTEAISALTAPETGLQTRLENVINAMGEYAKKTDMTGYVTATQVTTQLNSMLNGYLKQSDLSALQTTLNTKIAELESFIDALGTVAVATTDPAAAVTANIEMQFGQYVILPRNDLTEIAVPLRLTVTNNMPTQAKDVRLAIDFQSGIMQSVTWAAGFPALNGGTTMWQQPFPSSFGMSFQNGWGLNINAESTVQINLLLTMQVETALSFDMYFQPQVSVVGATA